MYGKLEEWLLQFIKLDTKKKNSDDDVHALVGVARIMIGAFAALVLNPEHIYQRGREIEAEAYKETEMEFLALLAAVDYYEAARFRGIPDAAYRVAKFYKWEDDLTQFGYPKYLAEAAQGGVESAIHDYVYEYEFFAIRKGEGLRPKDKRLKRKQDKLYAECCRKLTYKGDMEAQWKLGYCYLQGTGTEGNWSEGVKLMEEALEKGEFCRSDYMVRESALDYFKKYAY